MHLGAVGSFWRSWGVNDHKGIFSLSSVRAVMPDNSVEVGKDGVNRVRCDRNAYGPYGFHTWIEAEGRCTCGRTEQAEPSMGHHLMTLENIHFVCPVVDIFPYGYILYFECSAEHEAEMIHGYDCESTRTLQEVIRLMMEWDIAHTVFGNTEPIAVASHNMLRHLAPPDEVLDWVWNNVPPQKVQRFLSGDTDARSRLPDTPVMSEDFDHWICTQILTSMPLGARRADR